MKLLPCPFCGGEPIAKQDVGYWSACCNGCDAEGPPEHTKARASEAWNRRTPAAPPEPPPGPCCNHFCAHPTRWAATPGTAPAPPSEAKP